MSQIWDIYCKHCLWSIFGPCWCTKSCKTTFYAHLSRIWKLARFTRFIRKVFATKILLSGKFSLFVTLDSLFQLGNLDWIAAVRFQQLLQGSHQRKDNWGGDKDVQLLQELYLHLYLSYVFLHDQKIGQLLISLILDLAECNIYGVDVVESFSGPKKGVEWLRFFASTRVLIFTAERVLISGLTIIWRLSC